MELPYGTPTFPESNRHTLGGSERDTGPGEEMEATAAAVHPRQYLSKSNPLFQVCPPHKTATKATETKWLTYTGEGEREGESESPVLRGERLEKKTSERVEGRGRRPHKHRFKFVAFPLLVLNNF